jgi:hypothetical protein
MGGFGGEAYQGDAIAESLGLLDLKVDEQAKREIVDYPPAADGEGSEGAQLAHRKRSCAGGLQLVRHAPIDGQRFRKPRA